MGCVSPKVIEGYNFSTKIMIDNRAEAVLYQVSYIC